MMFQLTHATWVDDDGPVIVDVIPQTVFAIYVLPENKATAVLAVGGGYVAVLESKEEVLKKLNEALTALGQNKEK